MSAVEQDAPDMYPSKTAKARVDKSEVHALMAAEYQRWIDFFHAGNGDFDDFLRKELRQQQMQPTGHGEGVSG